ncbi:hypothetical protein [Luteolibacter sp. AS25]|uniref:hypothetical protein n=1 Tax=Luteolibacter sp. AS25 TaxID=3135776 RepID=UPI00398A6DCF
MCKKILLPLTGFFLSAFGAALADPVQVQLTIWESEEKDRETAVAHLDKAIETGETDSVRFDNRKCEVTPILVDGDWVKVKLAMSELKDGKWGSTIAPSLMAKFDTSSKVTLNGISYEVHVFQVPAN